MVPIRDLKNRLSEYLRRVRRGEHLVVTDRGRAIAEVTPIRRRRLSADEALRRMAERGEISLPRGRGLRDIEPTRIRGGPISETLLRDRG